MKVPYLLRLNEFIRFSALLFLLLFIQGSIKSQSHNVYITLGKSFSLSYEGMIFQSVKENGDATKFGFKFHGGNVHNLCLGCDTSLEKEFIAASAVLLVGKEKSFLDLNFGLGHGWQKSDSMPEEEIRLLIANIGYRYLFDSGFLRIGAGVPDIMYLSVGVSF